MNLQEVISKVEACWPSVFTKAEVLELLSQIEVPSAKPITESQLNDLAAEIARDLDDEGSDLIDISDAEFDVGIRHMELQIEVIGGVNLDVDKVQDVIEKTLRMTLLDD